MTVVPPPAGEPRRPEGPRDPGDAWVVAASGEKYWGRFGAAGLLAVDPHRGILLQHRVSWSHFGGTWGLPGGALHQGESAIVGAVRESQEEAGVPDGAVRPRFISVLDLDVWSYTTVVADVQVPFDPVISDPESVALEWVPVAEVESRPLHPGFGAAWPALRAQLDLFPAVVVDAANVVGSVPDSWWKDRAGAAARLRARLDGLAVAADEFGLDGDLWFPEVSMVVEGQAKAPDAGTTGSVRVVKADAEGDDAIVAEVQRRVDAGQSVLAVTSDRGLRDRVEAVDRTQVRSAGWLLALLERNDA
ncbi:MULTISPECIES: NUDIX domain-containing protein [unclassified Microbacterium]|uniref:NUDIX domain-containing protein n=1 Tax=unclassified Microbacterium TaxID=2609290 RepID=UPI000EAA3B42|nr:MULTISPECIES: NUDIX hydrolase [unclassified Microbacterium]MBT2486657.1 NUDIX domain-containing protein [Microbacterium sp. ISL-108]RKN69341.1 NUDIX domain-containing protein [Microbacterium sp. CGR2]